MVSDSEWQGLFNPKSVAVIGASNTPGSWGERITRHLIASGNRPVYPVNPNHPEVQGLKSYQKVADIPEPVDHAVIVVRAELVAAALQELVNNKVKTALIISGGFGETGEDGRVLEAKIVEIARSGGIRFIGPNTMGHMDTYSQLNTLSFVEKLTPGPLAMVAQSGNMGTRIMQITTRCGIGFNRFVCCGNEANITLEDYLEFFAHDPGTRVIMLYIEGLRDARRFLHLAKKITREKPIVAMKAGGTKNASRASKSHTGVLSGSDAVYTGAFKQAGVIRVEDDGEMVDVALALVNQPLPRSNKVGILTMGGGLGVVSAEACEKEGLEIAELEPATIKKLDALLPARWSKDNPVDLVGSNMAQGPDIVSALWIMLADKNLDSVISNAWIGRIRAITDENADRPNKLPDSEKDKVRELHDKVSHYGKPFFMVSSPPQQPADLDAFTFYHKTGFSIFPQPRRAARTLRHLNWYRQYLESGK